jgi:putative ABC transport system permease protein
MTMSTLAIDLKLAVRALAKSPGFAAAAVATLALGIGANTAIFSIVRAVLWRPLPYLESERLVRVGHLRPDSARPGASFSPQDFDDLKKDADSGLASAAAYFFVPGLSGMNLNGAGEPARISVAFVSGGFFPTLGVPAAAGRTLRTEEDAPGKDDVVVLSRRLVTRQFGGEQGILGRVIRLDGKPFTVVGIMPRAFAFPSADTDAWAPLSLIGEGDVPHRREVRWLSVVGRLAPGTTLVSLRSRADGLFSRLAREYPDSNEGFGRAAVEPLSATVLGDVRPQLLVLFAAVALVLLIACANLASLLLARSSGRIREIAIRTALGAPRGRIVQQLLTESGLVALAGGAAGWLLGAWTADVLTSAAGRSLPRAAEIRMDGTVLLFAVLLSLATGLLFGLLPALFASRPSLTSALEGAGRSGTPDRSRRTVLRGLVAAEAMVAVVLLIGAGLLTRSLWNLMHVDTGAKVENVLTLSITIPGDRYPYGPAESSYRARLLEGLRAIPGVTAVGASKTMLLKGGGEPYGFSLPGRTGRESVIRPESGVFIVTPGFFPAVGIPVLAGRDFTTEDIETQKPVILVNRTLARQLWPGEDPVGKIVLFGQNHPYTVIGVAGDARQDGLSRPAGAAVYGPISHFPRSTMKFYLRSKQEPAALAAAARGAIARVDPDQPVSEIATLQDVLSDTVARPRLVTWLLVAFGALAVGLAVLGVYGLLSYTVAQRTREIGVRMALGASPRSILRLVVGEGALLCAAGAAVAVSASLAGGRLIRSLLFGVRPADPTTLAGASLLLVAVAAAAAALPARRAASISPTEALRNE